MDAKYQKMPHSASRLVLGFAVVFLLGSTAMAQQLEPNPNYDTITVPVGTSAHNSESFCNFGVIYNNGIIDNRDGGTLHNEGSIHSGGTIENYGDIDNVGGDIYISGTIDNRGSIANVGNIHNTGTFGNYGHIDNRGTICDSGTIFNSYASSITNEYIIDSSGTIENQGTIENTAQIFSRGIIENSGTIYNAGYIHYSGTWHNTGTFNNDGGIFIGTGTFIGTLDTGTGTVAPGSPAGTMYVDENYILHAGKLEIEIGGFDAGESDLLDIAKVAFLTGGIIDLLFVDGYDIASDIGLGQSRMIEILRAGHIDSFVSEITYDFLGTPPGFVYEVYQEGNGLIFKATNTNGPPVIFVDADATGTNDGTSWDDAYNCLQDALAVAANGDEIWVADGVYQPDQGAGMTPGDRSATFQLVSGVTLRGGYGGETILSGDLNGDDSGFTNNDENSYQVVTGSGADATAVLAGFTITAGNANQAYPSTCAYGGGMYNEYGSPTVANCTFSDNWAYFGGGICNYHSSPNVINCTFSANQSEEGGGGGMCNYPGSSPTLTNCTFSDNSAGDSGGGMWNYTNSSPILANCTFSANSAHSGGGLCNYNCSSPELTNCTFSGNSAYFGGGMYNRYFSGPTMTDCMFRGNSANEAGGAMYMWDSCIVRLINCTFSENSGPGGYSNDFADAATTYGEVVTTGDQTLTIMDEPDPDGVRVTTDSSGSAATPAIVSFCGGTTNLTFGPGADMIVNGCSIEIEVISGTVEIQFVAADGRVATTSLDAGNSLIAEQEVLAITAPSTNADDVVVVVDGQVYTLAPGESKTLVTVDTEPDTLNLLSRGNWITCYIELPEGLDVADIDVSTVELNGVQAQSHPTEIGDYDLDGVADLMVKFDWAATEETLQVGDKVTIAVTGELRDGTTFEGHDTIRVVE